MSTNYTAHFNLCQWEPADKVLREDFNADNAKIDAALAAHTSAIEQVKTTADSAFTADYKPVVVGSYQGDESERRHISLGFRPTAVVVLAADGYLSTGGGGAFWVRNGAASSALSAGGVSLTSSGFYVTNTLKGSFTYRLNETNATYIYFAFR